MKCKSPSTFTHMFFKDLSFHFGVPNEMNEEELNDKSSLNERWAQSECFVSALWMHEKMGKSKVSGTVAKPLWARHTIEKVF